MSKRKRRKPAQSRSQRIFWVLSLVLAGSMVLSLFIFALPTGPAAAPTPQSQETPTAISTLPPTVTPTREATPAEDLPTSLPDVSPTTTATQPLMGPVPATETPMQGVATPMPTPTATVTPTVTTTPTTAAKRLLFSVCGDSRDNPSVYRRLLQAVAADGSEFLIHLGDLVNHGTEEQWSVFRQEMDGFLLPFYPVAGNHDGLAGKLDGFLAYSGAPAAHYSFDWGNVHLALADSHNGGVSSAERMWLRDDLSASTQPVKMVFVHHPPFDPDGTDHVMAYGNEPFMNLMVEQGVDFVFAGHIHAYAQGERDGVVYTITGGAGAPLYGTDHPRAFHHYLRVSVLGEQVTIEVISI